MKNVRLSFKMFIKETYSLKQKEHWVLKKKKPNPKQNKNKQANKKISQNQTKKVKRQIF